MLSYAMTTLQAVEILSELIWAQVNPQRKVWRTRRVPDSLARGRYNGVEIGGPSCVGKKLSCEVKVFLDCFYIAVQLRGCKVMMTWVRYYMNSCRIMMVYLGNTAGELLEFWFLCLRYELIMIPSEEHAGFAWLHLTEF